MMDVQHAKELLTALADGINPLTGEALSASDSCNHAEIVRALYTLIAEIDKQPKMKADTQPENAGKPWSTEENEKLLIAYHKGTSTSELARIHKRTKGSIAARLVRLGVIKDRNEAR